MNYRNTLLVLLVVFVAWATLFYIGNKSIFDFRVLENLQSLHPPHYSSIPQLNFDKDALPKCKEGEHFIGDLNRVDLLHALWTHQWPASYFAAAGKTPPPFDWLGASRVTDGGYIDYFAGRAIKADLSALCLDCRLYERDSHFACIDIIEDLRDTAEEGPDPNTGEQTH